MHLTTDEYALGWVHSAEVRQNHPCDTLADHKIPANLPVDYFDSLCVAVKAEVELGEVVVIRLKITAS